MIWIGIRHVSYFQVMQHCFQHTWWDLKDNYHFMITRICYSCIAMILNKERIIDSLDFLNCTNLVFMQATILCQQLISDIF